MHQTIHPMMESHFQSIVRAVLLALLAACGFASCPARAAEPDSLSELAVQQRGRFVAIPPDMLKQRRDAVLAALAKLDAAARGANRDWAGWWAFVQAKELRAELECDKPSLARLQSLASRFYGRTVGLEHPRLVQIRTALEQYLLTAEIAQAPDPERQFEERIDQLEALLSAQTELRDGDALAGHVLWLQAAGQSPELVSALQAQAEYPNLVFAMNQREILAGVADSRLTIDETRFQRNTIAGADVAGQVHTKGAVRMQLVDDDGRLAIVADFQGQAHSPRNVVSAGPLRLYTSGNTSLHAQTQIRWEGSRLVADPTAAECRTQTTRIGSNIERRRLLPGSHDGPLDRLLLNAALSRADGRQSNAERESSELAERRIEKRMDASIGKLLTTANARINEYYVRPLARVGIASKTSLNRRGEYLTMEVALPDAASLSASTPADVSGLHGDLVVAVHESSLAGLAQRWCGGATWTDKNFSDLQQHLMGDRAYELRIGIHPRWSLTFDWLRPMSLQIRDGRVRFTFRAQAAEVAGQPVSEPFQLMADYTIRPSISTLHFERQGDVQLTWRDASPTSAARNEAQLFLLDRFRGFFLNEFYLDGLAAPAGGQWDRVSDLRVQEIRQAKGWIYLVARHTNAPLVATTQQAKKVEGRW